MQATQFHPPRLSSGTTKIVAVLVVMFTIFVDCTGVSAAAAVKAPAASGRTIAQIVADYKAAAGALPHYPADTQLNPQYREQMKREFTAPVQRMLDLIGELQAVNPHDAGQLREDKCFFLAQLSLYGDANATQSLTDASNSAVPADAVLGKVGLMAVKWWSAADAVAQKEIVGKYGALAKANPTDDLQVGMALTMARYQAASDEIANSLRDVVEHDLKGPGALKYQKQPVKIGRVFKLSVKSLNGPMVSVSDWKGKVVLIDFWATWCPPCRAALPNLIRLYQEDHPKGLEVLGISNDSRIADLKQFLAGNPGMVWPESFNPAGANGWNAISPKMDITGIPTTFIIDRDGVLRDIEVAYLKEDLVKQLLEQPARPDAEPAAKAPAASEGTAPANAPGAAVAAPAAATKPPAVAAAPGVAAAPANTPAATSTDPATPPASAGPSSDPKAKALLSMANNYIAAKRADVAKEKLTELLKKYPDSIEAKKAAELLARLKAAE